MLPPHVYQEARNNARFHAQVEIRSVPENAPTPCSVRVEARVVRVFRGGRSLRAGDPVTFSVDVMRAGDPLPAGGTLWMEYSRLLDAKYLEVFLDGEPPHCAAPRWQYQRIEAPTDNPVLISTPQTGEAHSPARAWWEFWK